MARWRHNTAASIAQAAQVDNFEITGVGGGSETWTWTLTVDGATFTETFDDDGSPTTAEIAAGVAAAINNSTNPEFSGLTAAADDPDVAVAADSGGRPFSLTLASDGTGTVSKMSLTANAGANDFQFVGNWSGDALPSSEDVIFEPGNVDARYGLDYSGTSISSFIVEPGCASKFGRLEFGTYRYLKLAPTGFDYRGSANLALFDIGSAAIAPYIAATGSSATPGLPAVFLKGSAMTTLEIASGSVGVAWLSGETSTVATILFGASSPSAAVFNQGALYLGSGLTLSTALSVAGGTCLAKCAIPTATVASGATLTTQGTGAVTTANVSGTMVSNSSGTITSAHARGLLDLAQDRTARTVTTIYGYPGGRVRLGSWITVTNPIVMSDPGQFIVEWVE